MCLETMDSGSKHIKPGCLRKTMKPGSKLTWGLLRVSAEKEREALKPCRASARAKSTTGRKSVRREQRRIHLAKLSEILGDWKEKKQGSACEEIPAAACLHHPAGAMAPENTTQYLMSNAYEDMKPNNIQTAPVSRDSSAQLYGESLSPRSVYVALDTGYESCLAFQQRDFEEVFGLYCGALDGARPVERAPEPSPALAPHRGTNRTHLSPWPGPRIVKARSPLPGQMSSAVRGAGVPRESVFT